MLKTYNGVNMADINSKILSPILIVDNENPEELLIVRVKLQPQQFPCKYLY